MVCDGLNVEFNASAFKDEDMNSMKTNHSKTKLILEAGPCYYWAFKQSQDLSVTSLARFLFPFLEPRFLVAKYFQWALHYMQVHSTQYTIQIIQYP